MILAHIAGLPVQESMMYVGPVMAVVGWIYFSGWRERRRGETADEPERSDDQLIEDLLRTDFDSDVERTRTGARSGAVR